MACRNGGAGNVQGLASRGRQGVCWLGSDSRIGADWDGMGCQVWTGLARVWLVGMAR